MAKYLVRVSGEYTGEVGYEVEADSPEQAKEIAKSGNIEALFEETECSSLNWEDADVRVSNDG